MATFGNKNAANPRGGAQATEHTNRKVVFSPALWAKWHRAREPDEHTQALRAGIAQMRALLAEGGR